MESVCGAGVCCGATRASAHACHHMHAGRNHSRKRGRKLWRSGAQDGMRRLVEDIRQPVAKT
eukprot:847242-Rhodomonas_salina.1